ncbi:hypothetical protein L218DRAFT_998530 [Marasmius fiardii PR-910]|nr:hypothetical protein L218DRAFT_998530 [Marasmius fiardii PR-910]
MSTPTSPIIPAYFINPSSSGIQWTTPYVRRYPMLWPERSKLALAHEYCSKMELWKTFHQEVQSRGWSLRPPGRRRRRRSLRGIELFQRQQAEIGCIPRYVEDEKLVNDDGVEDFDGSARTLHRQSVWLQIMEEFKKAGDTTTMAEEPLKIEKRKKRHGMILDNPPVFDKL